MTLMDWDTTIRPLLWQIEDSARACSSQARATAQAANALRQMGATPEWESKAEWQVIEGRKTLLAAIDRLAEAAQHLDAAEQQLASGRANVAATSGS